MQGPKVFSQNFPKANTMGGEECASWAWPPFSESNTAAHAPKYTQYFNLLKTLLIAPPTFSEEYEE